MVRRMPKQLEDVGRVFHALADPTRRQVVERLGSGPATTLELAEPFDMALPSFTQHLGVLADAGLVTSTKKGRVRTYAIVPTSLDQVDDWLSDQRRLWERRLDQFDDLVTRLHKENHQ
jgi:DNA-binding transcriptional ArsR family regulator